MADRYVTDAEVFRRAIAASMSQLHTAMPGKVVIAYPDQTADIQPQIKDGNNSPPVIPRVRVGWPRGGDGFLIFPLAAGDYGTLIFCESDLAAWEQSGDVSAPGDVSRHGLNGAVFYPGIYPSGHTLVVAPGASVLAGSNVMIGGAAATEPVIKGTAFYTALVTALNAIAAATVPPTTAAVTAFIGTASTYFSAKVKVE